MYSFFQQAICLNNDTKGGLFAPVQERCSNDRIKQQASINSQRILLMCVSVLSLLIMLLFPPNVYYLIQSASRNGSPVFRIKKVLKWCVKAPGKCAVRVAQAGVGCSLGACRGSRSLPLLARSVHTNWIQCLKAGSWALKHISSSPPLWSNSIAWVTQE